MRKGSREKEQDRCEKVRKGQTVREERKREERKW